MKYGFVKVASATNDLKVADVEFNKNSTCFFIDGVISNGANVILFPELNLSGVTCGDLYFYDTLISSCEKAVVEIASKYANNEILIVVGAPIKISGKIYDASVVIYKGEVLGIVPKSNLSASYSRWFSEYLGENTTIEFAGKTVNFGTELIFREKNLSNFSFAVSIGEDAFSPRNKIDNYFDKISILLCPTGDAEVVGRKEYVETLVKANSAKYLCGLVVANAGVGESTTDAVYSGYNLIAESGKILENSNLFNNGVIYSEIDTSYLSFEKSKLNLTKNNENQVKVIEFSMEMKKISLTRKYQKTPFVPENESDLSKRAELILDIQAKGLEKRITHTNAKNLVIGLSGGLDSTLALLVAVRSMNNLQRNLKDILCITMPCFGTTSRTFNNTILLAKTLGVTIKKIEIAKSVTRHLKDIKHQGELDVAFENAQARERTQVLMDVANMCNGLVVGTGDLSELALGWATYNGDHMSMYGVNGSIPKTLVRHLVNHVASVSKPKLKSVLKDILATPVSPELLPAENGEISQKTEEIVGPYILHDFYLYLFNRCGFSPEKIYEITKYTFEKDFSEDTIKFWLKTFIRRFFNQQFKRSCLPDGVKVGTVALSPRGGLIMPSDAVSKIWLNELENL